jgi:hypothetical protein
MAKYIVKTLVVLGKNNKKYRVGQEVTQADLRGNIDEMVQKGYLKIVDGEPKEDSAPELLQEPLVSQPQAESESIIAPTYATEETSNPLDDAFNDNPTTKKGKK